MSGSRHDDNCLNLLYGWYDAEGTFQPPTATPENGWQPHTAYHSALRCGCEDGMCPDCQAVWSAQATGCPGPRLHVVPLPGGPSTDSPSGLGQQSSRAPDADGEGSTTPPVYLCAVPEDCQGHYRRCPHNDKPGRFLLACQPCYAQRLRDGVDWCQTDITDGLPLPVSAYRSAPVKGRVRSCGAYFDGAYQCTLPKDHDGDCAWGLTRFSEAVPPHRMALLLGHPPASQGGEIQAAAAVANRLLREASARGINDR